MQKALFITIAIGAGIGLLWPSAQPSASAPAQDAAPPPPGGPRETVLKRSNGGHFYANVEINGELVRFLIDTGATPVAITEETAERLGLDFSPSQYATVGMGASGPVRGQVVAIGKLSLDGKDARGIEGTILEGADMNLLGQDFLGRFSVEMRGDTMRIY
jgi:aspartyl protease family protein